MALWDAAKHQTARAATPDEGESDQGEHEGSYAAEPFAVAAVRSDNSQESFPVLRCAVSEDGRRLLVGGGRGGNRGFLGTPVWLYDLQPPKPKAQP